FSRIINNRIIIPIKLLFELDQIDSNEFIHSSEDYKYFINAVVTYIRHHSQLKSQFMANRRLLNGQHKPSNTRFLSSNNSDKKSCQRRKSKSDDLNDKIEFHFGFELENIEDIHYTKELPNCHDKQIVDNMNNNKHRKRRSQLIKGEETHMLWQSELPQSGHQPRINIVTELNKWYQITADDIFYRDNSKDSQCGYNGYVDYKRKLRSSPRKLDGNLNKNKQLEMNFITFRLLRTNLDNKNSDESDSGSNLKKLSSKVGLNNISAKQMISIFNDGQFITWKKLAQVRSQNDDDDDDDKKRDCKNSQLENQRVLRVNTRRQAAAAAASSSSSISAQNSVNGDLAQENTAMTK
ncbi:hypothetical protein BLA29_007787, partial [Euroglyphus maynei]